MEVFVEMEVFVDSFVPMTNHYRNLQIMQGQKVVQITCHKKLQHLQKYYFDFHQETMILREVLSAASSA